VPLYDYKCTVCSNQYETREGFDAPPRQPCPKCGGEAKRLLHPPPIVFKGSGFYITDSRKGGQATLAENSRWDSASEANKPKENGAADSKPAAAATSDSASTSDVSD
jgi:putative FmdB family regulatory protein